MFRVWAVFVSAVIVAASGTLPAYAYKRGFDPTACATLCPVPGCPENASADSELKLSDRGFPLTNSFYLPTKIQRYTPFRVNMSSSPVAVNALILEFRSTSGGSTEPLGHFVEWSEPALRPIKCDGGPANALTNTDESGKQDFWFTWMPPDMEEIDVALKGTFVVNNEYWYNIEVASGFQVEEFPPSKEGCGSTKSCVTLSSTKSKCEWASRCDLSITYKLSADNQTMETTIGGKASMAGRYVALGFTNDSLGMKAASIFACIRTEMGAEVRHFTLHDAGSVPVETNQVLEDMAFKQDKERVWCRFSMPVRVAGSDLTGHLHQLYFWGQANVTTGQIELSPPYKRSKGTIQVGVPHHSRLTSASRENAPALAVLVVGLLSAALLWRTP